MVSQCTIKVIIERLIFRRALDYVMFGKEILINVFEAIVNFTLFIEQENNKQKHSDRMWW